ncbi:hypothetical protein [Streptomyces sp. NPDC048639]|uniref:hypothetical protein n=1 Tax=Streptomyces sp. NPDC048639 TaxID=3365581 RepID=UPI0037118356
MAPTTGRCSGEGSSDHGLLQCVDGFELFLARSCQLSVGAVPAWWGATLFFFTEEGRHFSFLVGFVLPPIAAYMGLRGKREIRGGMAATALALALAALPLMLAPATLERS